MIDKVVKYFKKNNVKCKKVEDDRGDFIAIFSYGNITRQEIVKEIKENNLSCMFFEGSIREDEYKKKQEILKKSSV
jgi:ABC-type Zn uptake system ZnuABC Zn-binding protein ZnuA